MKKVVLLLLPLLLIVSLFAFFNGDFSNGLDKMYPGTSINADTGQRDNYVITDFNVSHYHLDVQKIISDLTFETDALGFVFTDWQDVIEMFNWYNENIFDKQGFSTGQKILSGNYGDVQWYEWVSVGTGLAPVVDAISSLFVIVPLGTLALYVLNIAINYAGIAFNLVFGKYIIYV